MTPDYNHTATWMSRAEAANYLRISVRQLDRLGLHRSYIGRRALYSRELLDKHLLAAQTAPAPRAPARVRSTFNVPQTLSTRRLGGTDGVAKMLDEVRAILQAA